MIKIPTDSSGEIGEYTETLLLDGSAYTLKFAWNDRMSHWILSVYLPDSTPLVLGRAIVNGVNLLRGCVLPTKPPGLLLAIPIDDHNEHAGLTDLGTRVGLYYVPVAEGAGAT